jgi:bifunctional DNA-binding transcriptional regulator/antitoxin component of YhaV-PrlF toxin-antitoxin module
MDYIESMQTTITQKNMVSVPAALARRYGIRPGYRLEWQPQTEDTILVRVIPDRGALARKLAGAGRSLLPSESGPAGGGST